MWLKLIVAVLIVAMTFSLSLQGLYAAATIALCALVATVMAFALQDVLVGLWLGKNIPELSQAIALGAVFILVLIALRLLADRFVITRRVSFPLLVDRIGGAFFGLLASMLMVGTVVVCLQLLPVRADFLGFERYAVTQREPGRYHTSRSNLWFHPDRVAVGLVRFLSRGALRGEPSFADQHPDLLAELHWRRVGLSIASRHYLGQVDGALQVVGAWRGGRGDLPPLYTMSGTGEQVTFNEFRPDPDQTYLIVRVKLGANAADGDNLHRFTVRHFRIVGHINRSPRQVFAVGVNDVRQTDHYVIRDPTQVIGVPTYPGGTYLDVIFEVDDRLTPSFVEYKSGARADLTPNLMEEQPLGYLASLQRVTREAPRATARRERRPTEAREPSPTEERPRRAEVEPPAEPGRAVESVTITAETGTGVTARMPYEIYAGSGGQRIGTIGDNEVRGGKLLRGWFAGPLADAVGGLQQSGPGSEKVQFFQLPTDEPKIMVQLRGRSTQARTSVLRSIFNSVRMLKQYSVKDEHGREYPAVGYFAVVQRGGQDYVELNYFPDPAERRGMIIWRELRRPEINTAKDVGILYLVDPGPRTLTRFSGRSSFFASQTLRIDIPAQMPDEH